MRFLLDACVWGGARRVLLDAGHDVVSVVDEGAADPGDVQVLARAVEEQRELVTLDKDFGELTILRGAKHCGLLRLAGISARSQGQSILEVIDAHGAALAAGGIVTVESDRVRIRPAG